MVTSSSSSSWKLSLDAVGALAATVSAYKDGKYLYIRTRVIVNGARRGRGG